jgi:hypothetical protein
MNAGSSGPEDALMLMHRDGRRWREIKDHELLPTYEYPPDRSWTSSTYPDVMMKLATSHCRPDLAAGACRIKERVASVLPCPAAPRRGRCSISCRAADLDWDRVAM